MLTENVNPTVSMMPTSTHPLRWQAGAAVRRVWLARWLCVAIAFSLLVLVGLAIAIVMPRGPVTTSQALLLLGSSLVVGMMVGFLTRSRWSMLLAPMVHLAAFELGRINEVGPTVDMPQMETTLGIVALIVGRGFAGLVGGVPLILGVAWGAGLARWLTSAPVYHRRRRWSLYARRFSGALTTVGLVALTVLLVLSSSTPAFAGLDGQPVSGGFAEMQEVRLGGHEQWIMARGASDDLPVLLYLSGGPGQSDLPFSRTLLQEVQQDFVLVGWDQRGAGKSYLSLDPESLTLEQAIADTIDLVEILRQQYDEDKIYLMGESWGTILGVLVVQRRPDLFHAYIGSGQMVSPRETDRLIYEDLLAYAAAQGDEELGSTLRAYGSPPYQDVAAYGYVLEQYPKLEGEYDPPVTYQERGTAAQIGPFGVLAQEYDLVEKVNVLRGLVDMFSILYPQLQDVDFRSDVPVLEVPVYILSGRYELSARSDLTEDWFGLLEAPNKQMFVFENAGHSVAFEQCQELAVILNTIVLPETYRAS